MPFSPIFFTITVLGDFRVIVWADTARQLRLYFLKIIYICIQNIAHHCLSDLQDCNTIAMELRNNVFAISSSSSMLLVSYSTVVDEQLCERS